MGLTTTARVACPDHRGSSFNRTWGRRALTASCPTTRRARGSVHGSAPEPVIGSRKAWGRHFGREYVGSIGRPGPDSNRRLTVLQCDRNDTKELESGSICIESSTAPKPMNARARTIETRADTSRTTPPVPRAALARFLIEAIRVLIAAGDLEGARVAREALAKLVPPKEHA